MSQPTTWSVPLSGPSTPAAFAQRIDDSLDALLSSHKHTARPSYATAGTIWAKTIDSTETQLYYFDGTDDIYLGRLDLTNNIFEPTGAKVGGTSSGDIVTNAATQVLSNKTLLSPILNGGAILSANSTEINTACDGITATASEINTACDGITATASEINTACDGITATASEINNASDGIGVTIPRQKIVEIGDWNMDSTASLGVNVNVTLSKIIGLRVMIRNDADTTHYPLTPGYGDAGVDIEEVSGNIAYVTTSYSVQLRRLAGGFFDSTDFDSTSYNRGWIIVDYID